MGKVLHFFVRLFGDECYSVGLRLCCSNDLELFGRLMLLLRSGMLLLLQLLIVGIPHMTPLGLNPFLLLLIGRFLGILKPFS